jgi:hypothetical protein
LKRTSAIFGFRMRCRSSLRSSATPYGLISALVSSSFWGSSRSRWVIQSGSLGTRGSLVLMIEMAPDGLLIGFIRMSNGKHSSKR